MKPEKRKRPVAITTDLEKCHHPRTDKSTTGNYHSRDFPQDDFLGNCIPFSETLRKEWQKLQRKFEILNSALFPNLHTEFPARLQIPEIKFRIGNRGEK